ncbi:class I SAM-dependent methyltransferase [Tersicoccus sp. MR15.9]|uniref:class I SAM-dependent methyltransferase n=1 Tax=Tersicoccus mangrovi TaxID=3121635 RepID=UPI002FE5AA33
MATELNPTTTEPAPSTTADTSAAADRDLKNAHRTMWSLGDFPAVARDVIPALGPRLVDVTAVTAGETVLDIGAGSGNAAIPAARRGAHVVASDLAPALLDVGRRDAERDGVALTWQEADAEALPFADAAFDVVLSCVGIMFAPHHQRAADELLRVCRPGGRIGLLAWTPAGFIGQMFAAMKPFNPPPPEGASPPPLWGDEAHVRELLGDAVEDVQVRTESLPVGCFDRPEAFRRYFGTTYGPTVAAYRRLAADPDRTAGLDAALDDVAARFMGDAGAMEWEYLLVTARRR